ncbi:DUF6115 domain-containing protein [Schnuerera ultunensis]|uniref:Uncharacterized protein n=1 Tax=[Clostridium] ultunense Esp TaxID=1288971 RepID=A0A1M4PNJ8_9FIRM|nr:hypothetical protein [Schnuerera ultunensis]SHD77044.1 conserved protein of unknown function [[Clostridium] ultunense Esp]
MLTIILNVIGLLCIIISLVCINRTLKREKELYEDIVLIHKDIKYYSQTVEYIVNSFDELIENSLNKMDSLQRQGTNSMDSDESKGGIYSINKTGEKDKTSLLDESGEENNDNEDINIKVLELKELGLSNEEIAKKLNKGIREVDIIIKMWSNFYKKY